MRKMMEGVTLIELMVVVVIIAIIMGFGVPSYRQYTMRANRVDATSMLLRVAAAQERWFITNGRYATTQGELSNAPPAGLDGPIGRSLLDGLEKANIKGLAFFENGFRNFTNSKRSLLKPQDFKGLKFRTMENPVHLASVRQLGAQAVPMSWGEVYTSLQTGVIDGQENPVAIVFAFKLSEVQKYLSLTGHFYSPAPLSMSLKKFKGLKPEYQKVILDAALQAAAFERKLIRDNEAKQLAALKEQGMVVSEVDKAIFVEAMATVYDEFGKKYPGWQAVLEQIRATK